MAKDNSVNKGTKELDELKRTVSRAASEIQTSIGNIENLSKETVQATQRMQNAGNEIRKATNEIRTIKNDKKGEEDAEHKKKAARGGKITWAISTGISFFSLLVAIATFVITRNIGITANDMNMKTQEITYSFSNDVTHNTNEETLKEEFGAFFEHQGISVDMNLSSGKGNESQMIQLCDRITGQLEYIGTMFSCYPESNEICGEVTGIVVSSSEAFANEDAIYDHNFTSKFLSLNNKNAESAIEHQFIFDGYSVYLVVANEDKHLSFLILKNYSEEFSKDVEHTVYISLQGYSGKLRQYAIKANFKDKETKFSVIDENDIYDLEKVYCFLNYDTEGFDNTESVIEQSSEIASEESTNGDGVGTVYDRFRRVDPDEHQVVKLASEELESKFGIIRDRYEK